MKKCCKNCTHCRYIKTPQVTGTPVDFVCRKQGCVVYDIETKNCDVLYEPKNAFPAPKSPEIGLATRTVSDLTKEELQDVGQYIREIKEREKKH